MSVTWMLISFLPCMNTLFVVNFMIAERAMYIPSFGACLLFGIVCDSILSRVASNLHSVSRTIIKICFAVIMVWLVLISVNRCHQRNIEWKNEHNLYESVLEHNPTNSRAHYHYGTFPFRFRLQRNIYENHRPSARKEALVSRSNWCIRESNRSQSFEHAVLRTDGSHLFEETKLASTSNSIQLRQINCCADQKLFADSRDFRKTYGNRYSTTCRLWQPWACLFSLRRPSKVWNVLS